MRPLKVCKAHHHAAKQPPLYQGEVALQSRDDSYLGEPADRTAYDPEKPADAPRYGRAASAVGVG